MDKIAIVGASAAGLTAAETLRREGFAGEIAFIGDEKELPYDRPPLSKQVLKGDWHPDKTALRPAEAIAELNLDLRLGSGAVSLSLQDKTVGLGDGTSVPFDGLVIATGVRARPLPVPHDARSVHVIRTLEDALRLKAALEPARSVAIIGAGFLGMEAAAVGRALGKDVVVIDPLPAPMVRQLGPQVAAKISSAHVGHGVDLQMGLGVTALEQTSSGHLARLSDGSTVEADVVLVAIGSIANTEWLEGSGLSLDDGVVCDQYNVAAPGVVAAGDVARAWHPGLGAAIRIEHRMNATEQGRTAAQNLLGADVPFAPVPYFWSDQYDIKLQVYGRPGADDDLEVVEGDLDGDKFCVLYRRDGAVTAALSWNMPRELRPLRQVVADQLETNALTAQAASVS
jgi:NADPH-dependent 2,4-dienoyl-CoA reductase/sulfur reductase-like enzyme